MISQEQFANTEMGKAVIELSQQMEKKNIPPVSINVVGGFALMLNGIRDADCRTDIDYVGDPLPDDFNKLADRIGNKYRLGTGWINNDVMLSGISLEDFEYSTGKLHFSESMQVGNITINVLDEQDVLRMKLIAVDTSSMAAENGGEFSRIKDMPDVVTLLDRNNISCDQIMDKFGEYIMNESTPAIIQAYKDGGNELALAKIDELSDKYTLDLHMQNKASNKSHSGKSSFLDSYMKDLHKLYEEREKKEQLSVNTPQ